MRRHPVRHAVAIRRLRNPRERRQKRGHFVRDPIRPPAVYSAPSASACSSSSRPNLRNSTPRPPCARSLNGRDLRHEDAADEHAERRAHAARVLLRRVARGDVADLVPEHADELRFVVEIRQDAARDVDEPAGQRERVDGRRIDARRSSTAGSAAASCARGASRAPARSAAARRFRTAPSPAAPARRARARPKFPALRS